MNDPIAELERPTSRPPAATRLPVLPRFAALVEIAVLYLGLLAIDWLQPGIDLFDFRPHPFWLPVLLLSLQYGTVSGLLAAAIAIALTAGAGFPEQNPAQTYFSYLIKIWMEPMLWIGAAVLIGQFRMRQISRKQQLAFRVAELAAQKSAIADYAQNLRAHCNALERQIAGRSDPAALQVLQALDAAYEQGLAHGASALAESFGHVIRTALPGARATLYAVDAAGLRLAASTDPAMGSTSQGTIAPSEMLYRTIVTEGIAVSVLTRDGEARLGGHGIAAVPVASIAAGRSGRGIVGMLKIDEIDPAALGASSLPALSAIARAFAPALEAGIGGSLPAPVQAVPAATGIPAPRFLRHLRWLAGSRQAQPVVDAPERPASRVNR